MIIDARPRNDYFRDHITGAVSIPFYDLPVFMSKFLPNQISWREVELNFKLMHVKNLRCFNNLFVIQLDNFFLKTVYAGFR